MIFGYLFARDLGSFVALALVFGTAYGGVMPLYALVVREYFGEKVMGSAYGAVFLISTLGMGLGSFAGGAIYDGLGSYAWLFLASLPSGRWPSCWLSHSGGPGGRRSSSPPPNR